MILYHPIILHIFLLVNYYAVKRNYSKEKLHFLHQSILYHLFAFYSQNIYNYIDHLLIYLLLWDDCHFYNLFLAFVYFYMDNWYNY